MGNSHLSLLCQQVFLRMGVIVKNLSKVSMFIEVEPGDLPLPGLALVS